MQYTPACKSAAIILALAGAVACGGSDWPAPTARVPLVLLSIDGLKPDYALEADRHGLKEPTGVSPAEHGVLRR